MPSAWTACWPTRGRRADRRRVRRALLAGTGTDEVHLLVVCTAERGLCGAFNSSIARLAREQPSCSIAEGKTVKISASAEGPRHPAPPI